LWPWWRCPVFGRDIVLVCLDYSPDAVVAYPFAVVFGPNAREHDGPTAMADVDLALRRKLVRP
jgi:hypothetical protein